MAAITLQDNPSTYVGAIAGAHFLGALQYLVSSPTAAILSFQVQNTSDPAVRGFLTSFSFGNPSGLITGVQVLFNNTGMDVIGGPTFSGGIDCKNAITSWGNADIGFSTGADFNNIDYKGLKRSTIVGWQNGVFQLALTGTSLNTLNEASFHAQLTSGATPVFFPCHFMWMNDEQSAAGDVFVASS